MRRFILMKRRWVIDLVYIINKALWNIMEMRVWCWLFNKVSILVVRLGSNVVDEWWVSCMRFQELLAFWCGNCGRGSQHRSNELAWKKDAINDNIILRYKALAQKLEKIVIESFDEKKIHCGKINKFNRKKYLLHWKWKQFIARKLNNLLQRNLKKSVARNLKMIARKLKVSMRKNFFARKLKKIIAIKFICLFHVTSTLRKLKKCVFAILKKLL